MIRTTRPSPALKIAVSLACAALLALAGAVPSQAAFQKESVREYEKQLAAAQIQAATFNKRVRSIHVTLKDGRTVLVKYGKGEEPKFAAELRAKGIPVTILAPAAAAKEAKKPVKHKLRYIAGAILVVVVLVVGAVLLIDRRRKRAAE
jgi:hypothetical protein